MCGIAGFNWEDKKLAEKLTSLLFHRGPDQGGVYTCDKVSLGHRRLSIIDLSEHAKQPMTNENGEVIIVFNGEIFNYKQLQEDLVSQGHIFKSNSDTEVLVHLYEEYGEKMLEKLNGQFAFCIYDRERGELFFARDRLGILPLYYYLDGEKIIFASELKCILESGVKKEIDINSLALYFRFGYIPSPACILKNTFKLKPAHYMVYNLGEHKITEYEEYWSINFSEELSNPDKVKELLREGLKESASMRLIADVPVGAFLSGGIDSSAVVASIAKDNPKLKTFSVGFEYKEFDESAYAKRVAESLNTDHHQIILKDSDIRDILPELVEYYDEPFGDSSGIPTYFVSKFARKYVTVAISGDGGDEILGGYDSYRYFLILRVLNKLPDFMKKVLIFKITVFLKIFPSFELERVRELLKYPKMDDASIFEKLMEKIDREDLGKLLKRDIPITDETKDIKYRHGVIAAQNFDIKRYLEGDILTKVDRAAMAVNLETRPPFLDHHFVETCLKINNALKIRGMSGKWILKEAFKDMLPQGTIKRKKMGFGVPLKYYLKNQLKDIVEKYAYNFDMHDLFDREYLKSMSSKSRLKDTTRLYWNVIMFNMWYQRWMAKK